MKENYEIVSQDHLYHHDHYVFLLIQDEDLIGSAE